MIDVYKLHSALESIHSHHFLIEHYKDFLKLHYINTLNDIKNNLIVNNAYYQFCDGQAQQFLLSKLHESIDGLNNDLYFKFSANTGGTPWTQLYIAKRDKAYGEKAEYLIWRIDKLSKGYYLRLNQYSYIDAKHAQQKAKNLDFLRNPTKQLFKNHGLILAKTSNRGVKESEVAILFFEDNNLSIISRVLPELSREIYKLYSSINNWV